VEVRSRWWIHVVFEIVYKTKGNTSHYISCNLTYSNACSILDLFKIIGVGFVVQRTLNEINHETQCQCIVRVERRSKTKLWDKGKFQEIDTFPNANLEPQTYW